MSGSADARHGGQIAAGLATLLAVLAACAFFTAASYPGFMSFDSLEALRQARFQVEGSQYPPFGSYVWRVFDTVWPGPTLMQLFQNALLLGSFAWILRLLCWRPLFQIIAVAAVAALPPITGTMMVVWKDVAVAAFYLSGFAVLFFVHQRSPARRGWIIAGAIALIFCGMAYRFNAASGALPLMVYAMWLVPGGDRSRGRVRTAFQLGTGLLLALFVAVWFVNSFRFPTLERLERNTNMDSIMRFDLVGISRYAGEPLVPGRNGTPVEVDYIRSIYDPRHLNLTSAKDVEQRLAQQDSGQIAHAWLQALKSHPLAYLRHRAEVFREYIGLHRHEVFYVTHPSVDENKLGVKHTPNWLTPIAVGYVWDSRASVLERAWVYYAAAIAAATALFASRRKLYRAETITVLASGLLYLAPMYFITPAGDVRYNFWSIWGALLSMLFVLSSFLRSRSDVAAT